MLNTDIHRHTHDKVQTSYPLHILDQTKLLGFRKENKPGLPAEEKTELPCVQWIPEGRAEFGKRFTGERAGSFFCNAIIT